MKTKQCSERCFCTNCTFKSPSPRSSVQKFIADGKRADKLHVSNLPLQKRKVSENLITSHTVDEYIRNGLVSASEGSDQIRSEHTNKSKEHTAVLNMIHLYGNKQIRSSHLTKPCSCCNHYSHSSIIKRHPSVCQHCIRQLNVEKFIKSRRKRFDSKMCAAIRGIRSNPKIVCSAPCLNCLRKTFMIHSSNALATSGLNKSYLGSKSRCKNKSYETDNESGFVVSSATGSFNHSSPHQQILKIYKIQNRPKENNGIPMFKNKVDYFSFQNQDQSNRENKTQKKSVGLKPYVDKTNQHFFSFNDEKPIFIPRERNLCNNKKKTRAYYSSQSDQDKRLINTTDILKKPILDVISENKTHLFESTILNKKRKRKDKHAKSSKNTNPNNVTFMRSCFRTLSRLNKDSSTKERNIRIPLKFNPEVVEKARFKSVLENTNISNEPYFLEHPKFLSANDKRDANYTLEPYKHENLQKLNILRQKIKNNCPGMEKYIFFQEDINPLFYECRSRVYIPRQCNSNKCVKRIRLRDMQHKCISSDPSLIKRLSLSKAPRSFFSKRCFQINDKKKINKRFRKPENILSEPLQSKISSNNLTITAFSKTNKNGICVDSKRKCSRVGDNFYKKERNIKIDQNCCVSNTGTKSLFELFRPDHKCTKVVSKNRNIEPHVKMCQSTSFYCIPDKYDSYFCFKKNKRNRYHNNNVSTVKKKRKSKKSMTSIHCKSRNTQSRDKMNKELTKSECHCPSLQTDWDWLNFCFGTDYCKNLSTTMLRSRDLSIKYQTVSDLTSAKKGKQNDTKRYISDGRTLQGNNTDEDKNRPSSYSDCRCKMLIRSNKIKKHDYPRNVQKYDFKITCPCHAIEKKKYNKPVSKCTKKCQSGHEKDYTIKSILKQATKKVGQHKNTSLHNDTIKFSPSELNVIKRRRIGIQKHEIKASTSFITKSAYHLKNNNNLTSNFRYIRHNKCQVRDWVSDNQRKVSDQIAALRDSVCEPGFWVPYQCNQDKCTKRIKKRLRSPQESNAIIRNTRTVGSSTKESFRKRKLVSHKYAQTDNFIELKECRGPNGVTRFGSGHNRPEVIKPLKQKSMRSIYNAPQYKSMHAVHNLRMKTSKSNNKKHESKNTCRLYEDITKDKYKSNRKISNTLTLQSTQKNYDVYSKPEILPDSPHGSKLYNSGSRGRMRNALSKLLSVLADSYRLRKFPNVRTNLAVRVARSHTVPKMPVELENVLKNPWSRRVYTIGSNINLSVQFYKENSLDLDHIACSAKKGPAVSRSTSSSPYGGHSVSLGLLKKLRSVYASQVTNKSKNTSLYYKNNKTRQEIVKQEIVKSIPYECEPHVCIPGVCDPNVCFEIFKIKRETVKDMSVLAKKKEKSKSVGTNPFEQDTSIAKRCFCILMNKRVKNIEENIEKLSKNINKDISHPSITIQTEKPNKKVVLPKPYKKINKQSKRKNFICECFGKFGLINAEKESGIALSRKPAVYKRGELHKNVSKKSYKAHSKAKQDLVTHHYGNMETLMPYSKKKFKKSKSKMTIVGFYESKKQELVTEMSINGPKIHEYKKIKKQNTTASKIRLNEPNRGKYKKRSKQKVSKRTEKQYISSTEISISRPNPDKYRKIKKQNATSSKDHLGDPKIDNNKYSKKQEFPSSEITVSQPRGEYKKKLKQNVPNRIEKQYIPPTEIPISRPKKNKYQKRIKQDVSSSEKFLNYPNRRSNRKKKKQDILATKIAVDRQNTDKYRKQRITPSEISSSHPNRSKYKKRNNDNHSNSVHANIRKQKSKSPWETRQQDSFDNDNTPKYRDPQNFPDSKLPDTPVISKYVHLNAITKCLKTAIFNLPLGLPKKLKRLISGHYKHLTAEDTEPKAQQTLSKRLKYEEIDKKDICPIFEHPKQRCGHYKHKQVGNKQLNTQQAHAVTISRKICCKESPTKLKSASTAIPSTCLCPQEIFDNSECFKIPHKQNSIYVDEFYCNKSLNQSKRLGNHFKQIKLKNRKGTRLQKASPTSQTPDMPFTDVKRSENVKIFKSYPCCGRDHNQPELSIPLPKSVPSFFKSLYRKKRKLTLPKQNCVICLKSNLVEIPPADFYTNKCYIPGERESVESKGKIKKQKKMDTKRDKLCPLFDMVVDAGTMQVTNKHEVYRNLRRNFHAEKQDPKRSQKKQVLAPAIDLVMNRNNSILLNGDYMLRALGTNRKRMTKPALIMKTNTFTMSQPCSRHLLGEKPLIKIVKSDQSKSHPEYCTCCICSNDPKMRRQNHPKNCTCCICRYGCRYGVKIRTKENELKHNKNDKKLKLGEKATGNNILHATASEISSLVGNVKKVSGYVTGFASDVESIISELRVKPCSCGLRICKKETRKLDRIRRRGLKANVPPECVCGSKVCKLKHTKKIPYYKEKEIIKKKKAIEKKKREKRLRKETIARLKRYSKENASMRKRIKRQDKKAMKTLKKYEDYSSSWVMLADNAADVGRFGINTFYRMITSFKRIIYHPRDLKYRAKLAYADPTGTAAKSLQEFRDSGYSGTLARVRHRCATMQTSKYLISAMESHPVTNYLLHFRDKDPKQKLLKHKPMKEEPDIECNAFMSSLRKKPCLWLYRLCPSFYPHCLSLLNFWRQFTDVILFLLAVAIWSPCILFTEFCRSVMCCFMCAGGG